MSNEYESLDEGISTPEQQPEELLKIMPADIILMEAFKVLLAKMRNTVESYDNFHGSWGIDLTGDFSLHHGDADITLSVGRKYDKVKGTHYPRLLNKAIDAYQFTLDNKPLCLPRA